MIEGELILEMGKRIHADQIDVASKNDIHDCINEGNEDAIFISIYSPRDIGFQPAQR